MQRLLPKSRALRYTLGALVVTPLASAGGLYAYVQYRIATRPTHSPRVLVDDNGYLLELDGEVIKLSWTRYSLRFLQLLTMYIPVVILYQFMKYFDSTYKMWLKILLFVVQRSGPAFIKAGQWACTRHDMFSPEFRSTFGVLYNQASIHDVKLSHKIIAEEMRPVDEIFESFDPIPIGSGSIGQCHKAVMRDSGAVVAVKVMHPNVVNDISRDIYLINLGARLLDRMFPSIGYLCLPEAAIAWTNHLAAQIDFRVEAENLQSFSDNFLDVPQMQIRFPVPIAWSKQVLIESYAKGEPATPEFLATQTEVMKDKLSFIGMNCLSKMLLRDNFIHCDMHPGNILIDTEPEPPVVTLIDVGLCHRMNDSESKRTNELMSAFCYWDPVKVAETLLRMGTKQHWCNHQNFIDEITTLLVFYRPSGAEGEYAVIGDVLNGCFDVVRNNKVHMDPSYVNIMFSVLVLEGFIMTLNPLFNIAQNVAPWLVSEGHVSYRVWKSLAITTMNRLKLHAKSLVTA
eukprot:PhF_6_TR1491/c0_g1_i1/m.2694/K08869/ADCK, ABC1; aarF domain-containing kinase